MMTGQPITDQQVNATQPFTVTLEAQQWNVVMAALNEAPYRHAAPVIQTLSEQLKEQAGATGGGGQNASVPMRH